MMDFIEKCPLKWNKLCLQIRQCLGEHILKNILKKWARKVQGKREVTTVHVYAHKFFHTHTHTKKKKKGLILCDGCWLVTMNTDTFKTLILIISDFEKSKQYFNYHSFLMTLWPNGNFSTCFMNYHHTVFIKPSALQ